MKLFPKKAPHIKNDVNNKTVMGDAIVTLLALYFMAAFYYGPRVVVLGFLSVFTCWVCDALCVELRGRRINIRDFSPVVTGMMIPLLMPASIPYYVVVTAGIFAIAVVKQSFGGLGNNLFNPAAGGLAFVIVCWTDKMFSYPIPGVPLELWGPVSAPSTTSIAYTLNIGGVPLTDATSVLLGRVPGPMGAASVLVICACLLYLVFRRTVRFQQPLLFLLTAGALAYFFPRIASDGATSVFYEILGTPVLFCAAFLFSDPVTSPSRNLGKAIYGILGGVMVTFFSRYGGYEQTAVFALLLMNALVPAISMLTERHTAKERRLHHGKPISLELNDGEDFAADDADVPADASGLPG